MGGCVLRSRYPHSASWLAVGGPARGIGAAEHPTSTGAEHDWHERICPRTAAGRARGSSVIDEAAVVICCEGNKELRRG